MSVRDIIVRILADDQSKAGLNSTIKNLHGVESAASSLTKSLAGLVTVGTFAGLAKSAIAMGSELDDASKKFGVAAEDLSELQYVAKQSGVELEDLGNAFKFLNKNIAEAENPSSDAAIAFKMMGISLDELKEKTPDQIMMRLADVFADMEDGANETALALAVLGRSGANLLPFLNEGSAGIKRMREEGKALGATLTGEQIKALDAYGDSIDKIGLAAKATAGRLIIDLGDAVKWLTRQNDISIRLVERLNAAASGPRNVVTGKIADILQPSPDKKPGGNIEEEKARRDAQKKAAEDRKKAEADLLKAGEKGWVDYADAITAINETLQKSLSDATRKRFEEEDRVEADAEKFEQERIGQLKDLQEVQRDEFEITEKIADYRAEDALAAAMQYGNTEQALRLLNEGLNEHFRLLGESGERVSSMGQLYDTVFRGADGTVSDLAQTAIGAFHGMTDALVEFAMTGKMQFKSFANSVIADLMRIAVRQAIVQPLAQGLMGAFGLPGMAGGGPVIGGMPYMVGERGPEKFIPESSGVIVPNSVGGGSNVSVNISNESGQPVEARSARASFNAQGWVIDVVLDGINRNVRGIRTALGGA